MVKCCLRLCWPIHITELFTELIYERYTLCGARFSFHNWCFYYYPILETRRSRWFSSNACMPNNTLCVDGNSCQIALHQLFTDWIKENCNIALEIYSLNLEHNYTNQTKLNRRDEKIVVILLTQRLYKEFKYIVGII